ncbi:thioesterase family protein [Pseudomonas sp. ZM23]|uniref:Thioesterase family protein n=1 Tax=Pseudomonas triclosanedens TaxID=2961893 RepID=A0ABY6ZSH0_9PSED|nr:thioesterase family protein [Pseudomonas triclosanedens]MCP8467320.1 thioesterase family protein [Pseudomonas triclosanedens]MCP8472647.1 thioesterase family protein [Pseudomonas triclosanedens]MCP8478708.1 thioesterase family protein [Pseudomonas triclosanedens]WAI47882.1 thioesterase family protein [Pseudomonas triclosanedens]
MTFTEMLQAVRASPRSVVIPTIWAQGRASFGGLVAAAAYEAMRAVTHDGRPVRSLAITFVGPVEVEVPVSFEAEALREGKSVSQVFCRVVQNGQVVALVQGSFGEARTSSVAVENLPAPSFKQPEHCQELPYIRKVMPAFTQHIAMRWALGHMPFSSSRELEMGGWMRLRSDDVRGERMDIAHLLALIDAWPPATLPHLKSPAPSSSLTWTVEFIQPQAQMPADGWCQYRALIEHARDGYGHIAAQCWAPDGNLLAISRQTVTIFG